MPSTQLKYNTLAENIFNHSLLCASTSQPLAVELHSDILNKVMTFGGRQHNILDMGSERMVINVYIIIAHNILGFHIGSKH